jgi:hypothetical protein
LLFRRHPVILKYIERHSNHIGNADMARTQDLSKLNEEAINRLPLPEKGNRISYFPGAVLQGNRVPRGFGVRVTAGGAKSFIINYRIKGDEYRYTIGPYPDWSALRAVREPVAFVSGSTAAKIHLRIENASQRPNPFTGCSTSL